MDSLRLRKIREDDTQKKNFCSQRTNEREKERKNIKIMATEALKTLGNEAFKNNDFAKAIEHFTEAIGIDGTNHVLYSNRSAARVRR